MKKSKKLYKKDIKDIVSLSPMQEGILFHYLKAPDSHQYVIQLSLNVSMELEFSPFEKAWNFIIACNETLRTVFRWEKLKEPVQLVLIRHRLRINFHDFSNKGREEAKLSLSDLRIKDRNYKFNLLEVPFRITLCKVKENNFEIIISNHHILYDGWSTGIILTEFFGAYNDFSNGIEPLQPQKIRFKEFIRWSKSQDKQKQEEYWKNYLQDFETRIPLPVKQRKDDGFAGVDIKTHRVIAAKNIEQKMQIFTQKFKLTLSGFFYITWGLLLQRYYNREDVIFGTTVSGRSAKIKGIEDMVGLFINTIPLRVKAEKDEGIIELMHRINADIRQREPFDGTPLVDIKNYAALQNSEQLFDSVMVIENYPLENLLKQINDGSHLDFNSFSIIEGTNYDLTVGVTIGDAIGIDLSYDAGLFEKTAIERLTAHYLNIIENIIDVPNQRVSGLEIVTKDEKKQLLEDFNNTRGQYPDTMTIDRLFEKQCRQTPHQTAIIMEDNQLTYSQLNNSSNRLAMLLKTRGVAPEQITGIVLEPSLEMLIALLGVLKSGAGYLPIDPQSPQERIDYMLSDSNAAILLTTRGIAGPSTFAKDIVYLEDCKRLSTVNEEEPRSGEPEHFFNRGRTAALAYVIYTSGTTGKPKGVLVEHRNVVNLLSWFGRTYQLGGGVRVLQATNFTFDPSVEQIFGTLLHGAALYMVNTALRGNDEALYRFIDKHQIHIVNFVPALIKELLIDKPRLKSIRFVIAGGEKLDDSLKDQVLEKGYTLSNHYGPTETTIEVLREECMAEPVTLGTPISNIHISVLHVNGALQPIGVPGELCISGAGLSRGYLNCPQLTFDKFITTPRGLVTENDTQSSKIYRSGDLARWRQDGKIEFLGRMDHQVKIRGFRIELAGIEKQLLNHSQIKEAVVVVKRSKSGENFLCAYVVPHGPLDFSEVKNRLTQKLPGYMLPSHFMAIDTIPLTQFGKTDRQALVNIETALDLLEYIPPANHLEITLSVIWAEVLEIEAGNLSMNSDFFHMGGHSLKAVKLVSRIHRNLDVVIPLTALFDMPTIRGVAQYINENDVYNKYIPIQPVAQMEYYPLSSIQKRLYFLQQMDESGIAYNMPSAWTVSGQLDLNRLETAFNRLIQRHESLRTAFPMMGEEPVQKIIPQVDSLFDTIKLAGSSAIHPAVKEFIRPFDLTAAPLLRVALLEIDERNYVLLVDMHHIIADGVSTAILFNELITLYSDRPLPQVKLQYKDFSQWQHENEKQERPYFERERQYWHSVFQGEIPALNLPVDYPRPVVQRFEGSSIKFALNLEKTRSLKKLAQQHKVTLHMMTSALYYIFLSKISNQEDLVVGMPAAGRSQPDLEGIIGMFVNTFALRIYPCGEKSFTNFLVEVKTTLLKAVEHQAYPYEKLVEEVVLQRDPARNPLFDTMLLMQEKLLKPGVREVIESAVTFRDYEFESLSSKVDLTLEAMESSQGMQFQFQYSTHLFKPATVRRFIDYFFNILSQVLQSPEVRLSAIEMLSVVEKRQVLLEFNDTRIDYPREKSIHHLIGLQVSRTPDAVALVGRSLIYRAGDSGPVSLSYRELDARADRVAEQLADQGARQETIVGLLVERSLEMIIGILGILKAGAAYLPLAPDSPPRRLQYMIEGSGTELLLSQSPLSGLPHMEDLNGRTIIDLSDSPSLLSRSSRTNWEGTAAPHTSAYLIYTSGSTGNPKGILVEHQNVVHFIKGMTDKISFIEGKTILALTTVSFDIFVLESIVALSQGLKVVIADESQQSDPHLLTRLILDQRVDMLQATPSRLKLVMESPDHPLWLKGLKELLVGGEAFPSPLHQQLRAIYNGKMYNLYGPTETTVYSTLKELGAMGGMTIGTPIANTRIYILNKYHQLQALGISGELCIAGDGVARGYYNNTQLTAEKFIPDPFVPGQRLYRTGDLARWLPAGDIEFLGRIDQQVKVRGFRVELEEIEKQLVAHDKIKETIVVVGTDDTENQYLAAYFVTASEEPLVVSELRDFLSERLPDYMVPSYLMPLQKIPLTPSGKINRLALPAPQIATAEQYIAPRNKLEKQLVEIWSRLLGVEKQRIGMTDNFFQLGGHSLKASTLLSRVRREWGVHVPLAELFKRPSVKALGQFITDAVKQNYMIPEAAETREYYALSSAQKRLYVLQRMDEGHIGYNIPWAAALKGTLNTEKISDTFQQLVARHQSFRTSFEIFAEEAIQRIHPPRPFIVEYYDAGTTGPQQKSAVEAIMRNFIKPFDLTRPPLIRAGLVKLEEKTHILMVDMHHIVTDGVSLEIFEKEFTILYSGGTLPTLKLHYKDFSQWQNSGQCKHLLARQEVYWFEQFKDNIPLVELPLDYPRPDTMNFEGDTIAFEIGPQETAALNTLALEEDATLFMVVLALFYLFLAKISGQEDIVIGTPSASRSHEAWDQIIGMFVNMLALRNFPLADVSFTRFLKEVRKRSLDAFENQDYHFEDLVHRLGIQRDGSRSPLFDVAFALDIVSPMPPQIPIPQRENSGIEVELLQEEHFDFHNKTAKSDLILKGRVEGGILYLYFEYRTTLFSPETIEKFIAYFREILAHVLADKEIKLNDINISYALLDPEQGIIQEAEGDFGF
jgi:tyrocidine synthetase III